MSVTINGDTGIDKITDGSVVAADIGAGEVTQAKIASGVAGTGPAFSAYMSSNQSITALTLTKVIFNIEDFDTDSNYDHATNYRFTPTVAGYYLINSAISFLGFTASQGNVHLYKNGSTFAVSTVPGSGYGYTPSVSTIVYANGTTDYFEVYAGNSSTDTIDSGLRRSNFSAVLVRKA